MSITIETTDGRRAFRPGDRIEGTASWYLEKEPRSVELRLFWYTQGKGTQDVEIVQGVPFDNPGAVDSRAFSVELPLAPYSFSGKLISLLWGLELVAEPGGETGRLEITVSPTGVEILLRPDLAGDARPG
ncbi:MAG TPA: hypothetical protein VEL74_06525 [Thermoanaerobaculia bacterium]|nr:hypothetical protein [Thermoanaerobaculia bacterium]